jgi:hypothetical protein
MRATLVLATVAVIGRVVVVCDGSSTSPFRCDDDITIASFADVASVTGIVTSLAFASGSSATAASEIVHVLVRGSAGSADFTIVFVVSPATAVFERSGNSPPMAASACRLALGERVQLPFSLIGRGFGDFPGDTVLPPPTAAQVVIVR